MDNVEPTKDGPPPVQEKELTEGERAEMQRLDALIIAGRDRPARTGSLKELKALLFIAVLMLFGAVGSYMGLPSPERRVASLMICITGGVISGWGGLKGASTAKAGGIAGIGWIYAVIFGGLGLIFGVMSVGLVGWLDGK